jgi:hypothetical protein
MSTTKLTPLFPPFWLRIISIKKGTERKVMNTFLFSQKKTPSGEEQESPVRLSVEEEVISLKENAFPLISQDVLLAGVADLNPKFF